MVNPLALSYAKLKQFHQNPQYNPGIESVYNRAMSAPTTPNIGGEIIRNLLGVYIGSKLGDARKGYAESERLRKIADERSMLDYRAEIEAGQREQEARNQMGLLGYKQGLEYTDPAKYIQDPNATGNIEDSRLHYRLSSLVHLNLRHGDFNRQCRRDCYLTRNLLIL